MGTDSETSSSSLLRIKKHRDSHHKKSYEHKSKNVKKKKKIKIKKHKSKKYRKKLMISSYNDRNENYESIAFPKNRNESISLDTFGPALPPHMLTTQIKEAFSTKSIFKESTVTHTQSEYDNSTEIDLVGPLPLQSNEIEKLSNAQLLLEERALKLKMDAIDGNFPSSELVSPQREEWMVKLPDVKKASNFTNTLKTCFYQGKEKPDFSDRLAWTRTAHKNNIEEQIDILNRNTEMLQREAENSSQSRRDAEQDVIAKNHMKLYGREESLVEIHKKKLYNERKRRKRVLEDKDYEVERRPFNRDIDLKLLKFSRHQTKQIIDEAKLMDNKFSSGHIKYL